MEAGSSHFADSRSRRHAHDPFIHSSTPISPFFLGHGSATGVQCVFRRPGRSPGQRGRGLSGKSLLRGASGMEIVVGALFGFLAWFIVRYLIAGFYTVDQNERAVITSFGRAERLGTRRPWTTRSRRRSSRTRGSVTPTRRCGSCSRASISNGRGSGSTRSRSRPRRRTWPSIPRRRRRTSGGTILDAVTKDQLNTGLAGQIRYRVAEPNLYAYLFGVKNPIAHVMGYFVSVLRERIANFEAPPVEIARPPRGRRRRNRRSRSASRSTICARTCAT